MEKTEDKYTFELNGKTYKLNEPTMMIDQEAARHYAKEYRAGIADGLVPSERLEEKLLAEGLVKQSELDAIDKMFDKIEELLAPLRKGGIKLSDMESRAREAQILRLTVAASRSYRARYSILTADKRAEEVRINYLLYKLTEVDGKPVWANYDEFVNCKDVALIEKITTLLMDMLYPVTDNVWKTYPENEFLIKYGFFDNDLNDKSFEPLKFEPFMDEDGKPVVIPE